MMIRTTTLMIFLTCSLNVPASDVKVVPTPTERINQFIELKWEESGVQPAPLTTESDFIRRVYLDLVGRPPTRQERQTFLDDQRSNKREMVVDLLVQSEDYVHHFTDIFDTLLMGRGNEQNYREREQHQWRTWLERVFRENRPWNQVVAEILMARPESKDDRGLVWFLFERKDNHQEIAEAIAPAFFGIRIECAQCHDHMIATEIEQAHYWGLVAFFNRGKNTKTPNGPRVSESAIGGFSDFANLEGSSSPNLLTFFQADVIEESRPAKDQKEEDHDDLYVEAAKTGEPRIPKFSRREKFVNEVVKDHPLIARAFVNRTWALLLGRGIVHPFDEMDSVHEPSHPELLDWLAQDFRDSGYNIRRLVRMIAVSDVYQLESRRPAGVEDPSLFAWNFERPLTAEQLSRSIQLTLRGEFKNDDLLVKQLRTTFPEVLPETIQTGVKEALFLSNNSAMNQFIEQSNEEQHLLRTLLKLESRDEQIILLFETLYGRVATTEEVERISQFLDSSSSDQRIQERWRQVIWAMITSAEFRYNH